MIIEQMEKVIENIERHIVGKREVIELSLTALLSGGHILLEDVPGVGKTALVKVLAQSLQLPFQRIQFTPDLLPSDILGVSIYNPATQQFEFKKGPIFGSVLLADELNRASPKTQSALLESMEEQRVTMDGATYALPQPFFVMATQNPATHHGTYDLPEAQLDRFLFKVKMGYPEYEEELFLLNHHMENSVLQPVLTIEALMEMKREVHGVKIHEQVQRYLLDLVRSTRIHPSLDLGLSPRSALAFQHATKAYATLKGRMYVTPDDIQYLFPYIALHRLHETKEALFEGMTLEQIVADIIVTTPVPVGVFV
ncbi:MoxR family ATPase [Savagea sp. SN6]|uniref:MoxR family ATPase n=1 Tax=Savagea serpentis TaxID=2785297 RepID=A0A8J7KFG2_9BACL|nr:MoxR family ATPase [Savagea serpentis]MBF4502241.1 MoxR family ATPase [Savagea serpentis]